ncbi:MAG: aromatic ring-hydroxylating dioxygenase subunit alpha [Curvibacter lanceolatus]|jgi:phenylpropionate dioxygenase-like ring-hydroxylating dioxygenase large terminal subunit|uniref:aromatic ring-hydroxylating dioxygenase subunit alpha n=1 Tax=Curvibacter lanceolatus TaxID=86182 RepID=UPI002353FF07|nr:aromatic ring-hydroxylating dioxygenase subunit alpha [Curvibacter lanceolatus]MBV5292037.1 aromatic ring-hydroxylating dioxygenase subunit alpha [Curvibacter lanceolatus]
MEKNLWHPVALASAVQTGPVAVTLLEQPLVLWRDADGLLQAWADRCPHRGARLSLGQVQAGRLECPYHGWQFESGGRCVQVPALPDFTPPASHCATAHACREAHGLVWVRLEASGEDPGLPPFEAEADAGLRKMNCGPYDVAASAPRIVENFLDMAHFSFVHEGWLGLRARPEIDAYEVQDTPRGLIATGCKAWQPQSNLHSTAPAQVEYGYEVTDPYCALLTKVPEAGTTAVADAVVDWRESIALYICPVTPETSRVWFRLAVADFESPDEKLAAFQHTIFTQDQPVLESQTPKRLPLDLQAERHAATDRVSVAYRRMLARRGVRFGVI